MIRESRPRGVSPFGLLARFFALIVLVALVYFAFRLRVGLMSGGGSVTACKSNLKNLGDACEMYYTDANGSYPQGLNLLTPKYLKTLPNCPAAGTDTYSASYELKMIEGEEETYSFGCQGENHRPEGLAANYPRCEGHRGVFER